MPSKRFQTTLARFDLDLSPRSVEVLQLNITRLCNQACTHCHVDASPTRTEMMSEAVMQRCIDTVASHSSIQTVDITGGAPELHPSFEWLVRRLGALDRRVIVRHNLTVTLDPHPVTGASMEHLPEFFARAGVELVCSLPFYTAHLTDRQRGQGAFEKSVESLRRLNEQGFGMPGSGLVLNLVTNPAGPYLPGCQSALEADFRRALAECHDLHFNALFALTNMPIERFAKHIDALGCGDEYLDRLASSCSPAAASGAMCRSMVSVSHDGTLYDCDFNQMLGLAIGPGAPATVFEFDEVELIGREIRFADHCFGCTAGAGSSCGGATAG